MCIIFVANNNVRPTEEMLRLGWKRNEAGAGAAWRENGKVKFSKGLSLDEIIALNKKLPFPYVIHERFPSEGTAKGPEACHPFVLDEYASTTLKGTAVNGVLFHNGLWGNWKEKIVSAAMAGKWKLPGGAWSDTRGLALMTYHLGTQYLEWIDQKVVVFTKDDIEIFGPAGGEKGWNVINGVLCSNRQWEAPSGGGGRQGSFTQVLGPTGSITGTEKTGGSSHDSTFRSGSRADVQSSGSPSEARRAVQEKVQQGNAENLRQGVAEQRQPLLIGDEKPCQECALAPAKFWIYHSPDKAEGFCWKCWDKRKAGASVTGESFRPQRRTMRVARCQFCWEHDAKNVVRRSRKPICANCWVRAGYPENDPLLPSDPRAYKEIEICD